MEITPANITQLRLGRDGRMVAIDDDVCGVAARLQEINPDLRLRFSEAGGHFVVYQMIDGANGAVTKHIVTTATELDHRLLRRVEEVAAPDYDLVGELNRNHDAVNREHDHRLHERVGPLAEQLAHAMRKDMGVKDRAFIGSAPGG